MTEPTPLPETVRRANRADEQHAGTDECDPERPALVALQLEDREGQELHLADPETDSAWLQADVKSTVDLLEVA